MGFPFSTEAADLIVKLEEKDHAAILIVMKTDGEKIRYSTLGTDNIIFTDISVIIDALHKHIKTHIPKCARPEAENQKLEIDNLIDCINSHMVELKKTLTLLKYGSKTHQSPDQEEKLYPPPPEDPKDD